MPSTFLGLTISSSGLSTYQTALNVTANNIANVDTDGYSRQEALQKAAQALSTNTSYGQIGTGVTVTDIEQIRNSYYDESYWDNNSSYGEYYIKDYYMTQIENLFYEDDSSAGYVDAFNSVFDSLEDLMTNSSDASYRTAFVNSVEAMSEYFNQLYTGLQEIQESANDELKSSVDTVNSIAEQIYALNKQINTIEQSGTTANELRDERALLIDELSELVPVEVTETSILTSDGYDTGATNYKVKICGQTLVDNNGYNTLECVAREEKVNQSDIDGLYDIYWSNGQQANFTSSGSSGKIKSLIDIRDGNNANNFSGTITDVDNIESTVTVSSSTYSSLNQIDLNDSGTIQLGTKQVEYDGYSVEYNESTGMYDFTFNVVQSSGSSVTLSDSFLGKTASVGDSVDYYGVPYYMSQINEFIRAFAETTNNIFIQGENLYGDQGSILFTGTDVTGDTYDFMISGDVDSITTNAFSETVVSIDPDSSETASPASSGKILIGQTYYMYSSCSYNSATGMYDFVMDDEVNSSLAGSNADIVSVAVSTSSDSIYQLTAGNVAVLSDVLKDVDLLGTTYSITDSYDSGDILDQFSEILDDSDVLSFRGGSATDFLSCILSDIAVDASKAKTFSENYSTTQSVIETLRQSVSGVDTDEEALNLVEYQNAYNLNAQMVQVLTEVYDRLILETGV